VIFGRQGSQQDHQERERALLNGAKGAKGAKGESGITGKKEKKKFVFVFHKKRDGLFFRNTEADGHEGWGESLVVGCLLEFFFRSLNSRRSFVYG
jgi:hypothetical protein